MWRLHVGAYLDPEYFNVKWVRQSTADCFDRHSLSVISPTFGPFKISVPFGKEWEHVWRREREKKNTCEYTVRIINLPRRCLACLVSKISKIRRVRVKNDRLVLLLPLQNCKCVDLCMSASPTAASQRRGRHKGPLCSRLKTGQERELKIYSCTSAVLRVNRSFPHS